MYKNRIFIFIRTRINEVIISYQMKIYLTDIRNTINNLNFGRNNDRVLQGRCFNIPKHTSPSVALYIPPNNNTTFATHAIHV